jgi:hypothetical protein
MKVSRFALTVAAILVFTTAAWAQKPDFSGTWTPDPANPPAAGGADAGGPLKITQTADALTIDLPMGDRNVTLTCKLDGTASRNTVIGPGGQAADSVSTAKWDGPRLTIVTKREADGKVTESTEVLTRAGDTLTVEITNARGTQKRIYKKQA